MASEQMLKFMAENPCEAPACELEHSDCYVGQWTVHAPHHYEVNVQKWRGGGTRIIHCPGKTEVTRLR